MAALTFHCGNLHEVSLALPTYTIDEDNAEGVLVTAHHQRSGTADTDAHDT
jgi:hypothetical protein